jgi:hypothetical protein
VRTAIACAVLAVSAAAPEARAEAPDDGDLVLAGLAMAPAVYFMGVVSHEGSHALAGLINGARVTRFKILPGRFGPKKRFYFGYTRVAGYMTTGERIFFWLAPRITDAIMLGGYSALVLTGTVPENRYGRLALAVVATGFWVDFSKDIVAFWPGNDLVKSYNAMGLDREIERLPLRVGHAALAVAGAYVLSRGYRGAFEDDAAATPLILPMWSGGF